MGRDEDVYIRRVICYCMHDNGNSYGVGMWNISHHLFRKFSFFLLLFLIFSFGFYLLYTQCNVYERRTCASASVRVHRWFVHTAYTIYGCGLSECHTDFDVSSASQCLHFSCTIKSSSRTSTEFSSKIPVVHIVYIPKVFHFFVFGYHLSIRAGHSAKSSLPPSCYHHFVNVHPNRASYQPELKPKTWRFGKTKTFAAFDKYIYNSLSANCVHLRRSVCVWTVFGAYWLHSTANAGKTIWQAALNVIVLHESFIYIIYICPRQFRFLSCLCLTVYDGSWMLLVCVSVCATLILESSSQKPIHYDSAKSNRCKLFLVSQRTSITTTICTQYNLLHVLWYLFNCKIGITSSPGGCLLSDWMAYIYLKSIRNYWLFCLFSRFEIEIGFDVTIRSSIFQSVWRARFCFYVRVKQKLSNSEVTWNRSDSHPP